MYNGHMADPAARRALEILGVSRSSQSSGETRMWTELIRSRLPSASLRKTADRLGVSVNELSKTLRLPPRTLHRRVEKRQKLTSEETERNVRVARALAKAQQLLGDENGRRGPPASSNAVITTRWMVIDAVRDLRAV